MRGDATGERYGRLVMLWPAFKDRRRYWHWYARCDCCVEKIVLLSSCRNGDVVSCGCKRREHMREFNLTRTALNGGPS